MEEEYTFISLIQSLVKRSAQSGKQKVIFYGKWWTKKPECNDCVRGKGLRV